jgi:hypothetical protein
MAIPETTLQGYLLEEALAWLVRIRVTVCSFTQTKTTQSCAWSITDFA